MNPPFSADDRRRLAEKVGVNPATLYQALTAKGAGFSPTECVRIERESWPELIGTDGAPPLPEPANDEHASGLTRGRHPDPHAQPRSSR
jgi:hypothetical protein